ncbi:MAG: DUF1542 domain-containing protein [Bacteroidales bacterium]|nr:DUF1542 domain-containing protein [Bacteroidales bacterium]
MKRLFSLFFALLTLSIGAWAQNNQWIGIGTGTQGSYNAPYNNYYNHSLNQTIYLKDEIGTSAKISQIAYYCSEAEVNGMYCQSIRIYMGHTAKTTFAGNSDYIDASNFTLVFSREGYTIGKATGWEVITLDSEFEYNGTDNLVVCVCKSAEHYAQNIKYRYTSSASSVFYRQSDPNSNYADITDNSSGTISDQKADIRLYITDNQSLPEEQAKAIDEIDLAIVGVTDEDILAIAEKAKQDINAAKTEEAVNSIKTFALTKINALVLIQTARQGIQNEEINKWIDAAFNDILRGGPDATPGIDEIRDKIMTVITSVQIGKEEGKAEGLGEMGTPCDDCPSIEVTKGDKTIKLYNPEKVEFKKE